MRSLALSVPGLATQVEPVLILVGPVDVQISRLNAFGHGPTALRFEELRSGLGNPNLGLTRSVSVFPVHAKMRRDYAIEQIAREGRIPAAPDVMLSFLSHMTGKGKEKTDLRRCFLKDAGLVVCLETVHVSGRGGVNMSCHQVDVPRIEGQRPFEIGYMDGIQWVPKGCSILTMAK